MNGMPYILFIILSVFTMNLSLQCALGIRGIAESKSYKQFSTIIKSAIILASVILLWVLFSIIISSLFSGIVVYVLLFPASFLVYQGIEHLILKYVIKKDQIEGSFISFPEGITAAASFICLNLAKNFFEALLLSFGFALGIFLVFLIVREIRRRAALESVPAFIRGKPLVLISLGLLSMVFSAASLLLLRMIVVR